MRGVVRWCMTKQLHAILIAGAVVATMLSTTAHAQTQRAAQVAATGGAKAYRFATVIKTQALRHPTTGSTAAISEARIDTQLIHSPAYPDLDTCNAARAAVAQLLGANVSIAAGSSTSHSTSATASAAYSNSECLPSGGP